MSGVSWKEVGTRVQGAELGGRASVLVRVVQRNGTSMGSVCVEKVVYFKELTHIVKEADKYKINSGNQQLRAPRKG